MWGWTRIGVWGRGAGMRPAMGGGGAIDASQRKRRVDARQQARCRIEKRIRRVDKRPASRDRWNSPRRISAGTADKETAQEVAAADDGVDESTMQVIDGKGESERIESAKQTRSVTSRTLMTKCT